MFEANFTENFGFADNLDGANNQESVEEPVKMKESKRSKVFKDERERIIDDYHSALLASAREADRTKNYDERKQYFNLISNK